MARIALTVFVSLLVVPTVALAQQARDVSGFLGSWKMDLSRSDTALAADPDNPLQKAVVDITKTNAHLHIHTVRNQDETFMRYSLEPISPTESFETKLGRLEWNGPVLVTYTPVHINGMALVVLEKRSLSTDSKDMIVETMVTVQHGYEAGNNYSSPIKDIYTRQSP